MWYQHTKHYQNIQCSRGILECFLNGFKGPKLPDDDNPGEVTPKKTTYQGACWKFGCNGQAERHNKRDCLSTQLNERDPV